MSKQMPKTLYCFFEDISDMREESELEEWAEDNLMNEEQEVVYVYQLVAKKTIRRISTYELIDADKLKKTNKTKE